jgi:hypothetical protein
MNMDILLRNWGLVVALALLTIVAVVVILSVTRRSGRGRLASGAAEFRAARRKRDQAARHVSKLENRLRKLMDRADTTKPRLVDECRGRLTDARALLKIADDQVLVAANQLRKVIVEEFPPVQHETLRLRYLPDAAAGGAPFSFDGRGP